MWRLSPRAVGQAGPSSSHMRVIDLNESVWVFLKAHGGRSILNILSRGKLKELRAKGCGGCRSAHLVNTSTLGPGRSTTSMLMFLCLWFLSKALQYL
ncbi:unnamed protein product [Arctogadus glacialis]